MCGIVGYLGKKDSVPIILNGLHRLEYRGYDSSGIAIMGNDGIQHVKNAGNVSELSKLIDDSVLKGSIGIGHTRWATHGEPSESNAHPHGDDPTSGHGIQIVHNGIIENYASIKKYLKKKGHVFHSETDTEVLAHLISELYAGDLEKAVQLAICEITGALSLIHI